MMYYTVSIVRRQEIMWRKILQDKSRTVSGLKNDRPLLFINRGYAAARLSPVSAGTA